MLTLKKVGLLRPRELNQVARILYRCGKDMAKRYDLHHWDNSNLKNCIIVLLGVLKNKVFLVLDGDIPVATFQISYKKGAISFQKLATDPDFWGKGIGTFCLNQIEKMAQDAKKYEKITCEVYEKSIYARQFYEHHGYSAVGKPKKTTKIALHAYFQGKQA